jgi:hypothetical protein
VIKSSEDQRDLGFYARAAEPLGNLDQSMRERPVVAVAIAKIFLAQGSSHAAAEAMDLALDTSGDNDAEFFELLALRLMRSFVRIRAQGPSDEVKLVCTSIFEYVEPLAPNQYMEVTVS